MTPLESLKAIKAIIDKTDLSEPVGVIPTPAPPPVEVVVTPAPPPVEVGAWPQPVPPPPLVLGINATPETFRAVLNQAQGGETIFLAPGTYPALRVGESFDKPVTITSAKGRTARFESIHFESTARNITLRNLSIWRSLPGGYILRSYAGASGLVIEDCDIRAVEDSINFMSWTLGRWLAVNDTAIDMRSGATIRGCKVTGVGRAMLMGAGSVVVDCVLNGMTQDGLRGGSDSLFLRNVVKNFFKVDATHRDAFQSYSGSTVKNLRVEDNVFIAHTHDGKHPLRGDPQGIGMFDGFYEDFVITGNVILTSHYHGITVLGARRGLIANNFVANIDGPAKHPWIQVDDHKNGQSSEDTKIINNSAMAIRAGSGVVASDNSIITDPKAAIERRGTLWNPIHW